MMGPNKKCLTLVILLLFALDVFSQVSHVGDRKFTIDVNGNTLKIPYYSNHNLSESNSNIKNIIVVIHGAKRNADKYYANMMAAAAKSSINTDSVLIIAPQFITEDDVEHHQLDNEHLYWTKGGWKSGSKSKNAPLNQRPERISSYSVLDSLLLECQHQFLNLNSIIITGHSAGGQITNRYAASSSTIGLLCKDYGISTKFIVANPSSYLYLDEKRAVPGQVDQFEIPATSCSGYNKWKYGMDDLYAYQSKVGKDSIRHMFAQREVVYLLGENDNDSNSSLLDVSCRGMLQGNHRLERGVIYFNYLKYFYGESITNNHSLDIVPNCGHSNYSMYTSPQGIYHLFESFPAPCDRTGLLDGKD